MGSADGPDVVAEISHQVVSMQEGGEAVTLTNLFKTPWPWFGGKSDAAPAAWEAMGDEIGRAHV